MQSVKYTFIGSKYAHYAHLLLRLMRMMSIIWGGKKLRARELEKILFADGWTLIRQVGSHRHYKHENKPGKVTIPFHTGDVDKGTANSILKQAGLK